MPRARNMNFVDGEPIRCVVVGDGAVGKVRDGVSLSALWPVNVTRRTDLSFDIVRNQRIS